MCLLTVLFIVVLFFIVVALFKLFLTLLPVALVVGFVLFCIAAIMTLF